jgi:hypothetical protein
MATQDGRSIAKGNIFTSAVSGGTRVFYVVSRSSRASTSSVVAPPTDPAPKKAFRQTPGYRQVTFPRWKFLSIDIGFIAMLPLTGTTPQARQPISFHARSTLPTAPILEMAALSPTPGRPETPNLCQPINTNSGAPSAEEWKVTADGAATVASWRADSKELYYYKNDMGDTMVMAVDVTTTPTFKAGEPRFLFRIQNANWRLRNISRDGQKFVFITNVPAPTPGK